MDTGSPKYFYEQQVIVVQQQLAMENSPSYNSNRISCDNDYTGHDNYSVLS